MAKRVKVVGSCACCKRGMDCDMRPINEVSPQSLEELVNGIPSSTTLSLSSLSTVSEIVVPEATEANMLHDAGMENELNMLHNEYMWIDAHTLQDATMSSDEHLVSRTAINDASSQSIIADFGDQMLNVIKYDFDRSDAEQTCLTDDNTGILVSMLREEQSARCRYLNIKQKKTLLKHQRQ